MPIQHIPCAPGAHIGEQIARDYVLRELTNSRGILLTNYHHPVGNGTEEHDLLLINERGVWAIEVKHWVGRIDADQVYWCHNNYRHPSPVTTVESKAKRIASVLREAGFGATSVVGIVLLTRTDTRFGIEPPEEHRRKVFRLTSRLTAALTGKEYRYSPTNQDLTPTAIQRVADLLVQTKVDPERRIIGSYRLLRELEPSEGFQAYEAQHVLLQQRRARVKQYQVTGYTSKAELNEAVRRFQQDVNVLSQLEDHPNILRAYDFQTDPDSDDTYWFIVEWIEGHTLRDRLEEEEPISFNEQLAILRPLTGALTACHQRGILHRNLTPASIYIADDGNVNLGDFDFARVSGIGRTISKTGIPLTINKYTAQELRSGFRPADERSDLYALGAIWYDMVLRRPEDEPILLQLVETAELPPDAKQFLQSLLAPQPAKRPASAQEVNDWLLLLG